MHALVRGSMQSISVDSPSFFEGGHLCVANALECMLLWALRLAYVCHECALRRPNTACQYSLFRYGADGVKEFPEPVSSLKVHKLLCKGSACFV